MRGDVRRDWAGADESGEGSALALGGHAEGGRVAGEGEAHWIEGEVEWSWPVWAECVAAGAGAAGRIHA